MSSLNGGRHGRGEAVGIACLVSLIVIELRIPNPILMLRLFQDRLFRTVKSETLLASMANIGVFGWLTYRYLRVTARNPIRPRLTKPRTQRE